MILSVVTSLKRDDFVLKKEVEIEGRAGV
jgi:hypothetical protein